MPRQQQPTRQLDSLIPALKTEEKRLEDLLAEARARAAALVQEAERQADARIAEARQALPAFLDAERRSRQAALERRAAQHAAEEERRAVDTERRGRSGLDEAADYIVSLVWPGATSREAKR